VSLITFTNPGSPRLQAREPFHLARRGIVVAANGIILVSRKARDYEPWREASPEVEETFMAILTNTRTERVKTTTARLRPFLDRPPITNPEEAGFPGMNVGILNGLRINRAWLALALDLVEDPVVTLGRIEQRTGPAVTLESANWHIVLMSIQMKPDWVDRELPPPAFDP
jgi:hypothetical protein